ncbi:MAG: hypothetical protein RR211_02075, partial [Pseudoflavonifractor sp.]
VTATPEPTPEATLPPADVPQTPPENSPQLEGGWAPTKEEDLMIKEKEPEGMPASGMSPAGPAKPGMRPNGPGKPNIVRP